MPVTLYRGNAETRSHIHKCKSGFLAVFFRSPFERLRLCWKNSLLRQLVIQIRTIASRMEYVRRIYVWEGAFAVY
jgi:hypothetical protein